MKVLLIEDDQAIAELLAATLDANRCVVDIAQDAELGLEFLQQWEYDVILLDVVLPRLDGISLCRQLRHQGCTTPILMLTAQADTASIVTGLEAGADDYVTKPFDPSQVLARLRALQRRSTQELTDPALHWGDLKVTPSLLRVTYRNQLITLSPKEYSLLELLLRHPKRIFSRGDILDRLWRAVEIPSEATVTNLVKDLRRKLKAAGIQELPIETLHGLGYRLKPPPKSPPEASAPASEPDATQTLATMQHIFDRFQTGLKPRLGRLSAAAAALAQGPLPPEQQAEARATAHKLVGSLGTFGYGEGSEIMRTIEHLLAEPLLPQQDAAEGLVKLLTGLSRVLDQPPSFPPGASPSGAERQPDQTILVIDADRAWTQALAQASDDWPLSLVITPDLPTALHHLAQHSPRAVVLNLGATADRTDTMVFLAELTARFSLLPVLVLADQDQIEDRTAVAPYGIRHFVVKPIPAVDLLTLLTQLLAATSPATALLVDDDPTMLKSLAAWLLPQGIQTTCLTDAGQFWQVIPSVAPSLLLLDLEMPDYNGIELCQTVRQDVQYRDLPIVIITAHTDSVSLQQAFAAGADDVIPKPVTEDQLISRISQLLERRRQLA